MTDDDKHPGDPGSIASRRLLSTSESATVSVATPSDSILEKITECLRSSFQVSGESADQDCNWMSFAERLRFSAGAIRCISKSDDPLKRLANAIRMMNKPMDVARAAFLAKKNSPVQVCRKLLSLLSSAPENKELDARAFARSFFAQSKATEWTFRQMPLDSIKALIPSSEVDKKKLKNLLSLSASFELSDNDFCSALIKWGHSKYLLQCLEDLENAGFARIFETFLQERFFDMDVTDEKKLFVLLSNFSLPQKDVEKLIGRDEDLQEVERKLNANGFLNVFGEKGVGKTSLVLSLLDRIWANYDYLLWIDASSVEALHLSLSRLSGLAAASKDGSQRSTLPEALEMSRQWIIEYIKEGNGKLLIIFDGLKDGSRLAAIPNFPPKLSDEASSSLNVLVTSKHRVDDLEHFKKFEFHYLNKLRDEIVMRSLLDIRTDYHDEQSVSEERFPNEQLTYKYQDASNRSEEAEAATWIAKKVDSSLLFVTVVKSFLKKEETVALAEYQEELKNELAGSQISPKEGILAVFERFLPAIKDVINFLAFCDSSSVPTELFQYLHFKETLDSQSPKKRREQLSNCPSKAVSYFLAIDRLSDYRLVKLEREKLIVMHQEIAKTAYQRLRSKEKKEHVAILCNVLLITFIKHNNWGMISSLYPHALRCLDHMEKLKLFDADLLLECGRMKSLLGDSRAAKELLEKCLNDSRASVYHKAMAHLHLTTVERRLSKLNVALERIDAAKSIWDSWKDPSKLCGFEKNKTIEAEAEVLLDAGEFTLAQTQLDKIGNPHDLYDDDNVSRFSLFANKARAHLGLGNYKESSEFYSRAIKYIPQRDYRHSMFQAYECIASALCCAKEEDEPATYEVFSKEVDRCEDIAKSMTHSHRYYAWVCRSVARLRHRQVKLLEKLNQGDDVESDIRSALKKAFQMVRVCIECHLAIFSGKHQKVAKACDLVGDLCCLWYETIGPRKKVLKCAMKHFQCARDIFKAHSTEDKENRLSAIKTRLESVEEKLTTNADRESNMSQCVEDEEDFQEEGIFDVLHNLGIKIAELK